MKYSMNAHTTVVQYSIHYTVHTRSEHVLVECEYVTLYIRRYQYIRRYIQ